MIKATTLTWHTKEEKPHSKSGSFLILTDKGDIAEAEYSEQNGWFQYRWSVPNSHLNVIAWCPFSDIERPDMD